MSFLEMLDVVNEGLIRKGEEPISFDSDCREGICGTCGCMVNGIAHGPDAGTTVCQLHMRRFRNGDTITIEPWRAAAFPVVKDLVVDRSALDRIVGAGGYISMNVGAAPDANAIPVPKPMADTAFDAAACIQCGACVAACKNASAALFTSAKIAHLNLLPQGQAERAPARGADGRADGHRRLRRLLQRGRVRSGVPEGNQDHQHRDDESRLPEGAAGLDAVGATAASALRQDKGRSGNPARPPFCVCCGLQPVSLTIGRRPTPR